MAIKITWYGHACFTLEKDGYTVAVDPYDPTVRGYPPLAIAANEVYATHGHHDHNYFDAVTIEVPEGDSPFGMRMAESFHDDAEGDKRGKNLIYIFESEGMTIAHLGDLGHILTEDQLRVIGQVDVVMVPVGGFYTIGAAEAAEVAKQLGARVIIPMHYRFGEYGLEEIGTLDDFLALADREVVRYPGNSISVDKETKPQIAVLQFEGPKA